MLDHQWDVKRIHDGYHVQAEVLRKFWNSSRSLVFALCEENCMSSLEGAHSVWVLQWRAHGAAEPQSTNKNKYIFAAGRHWNLGIFFTAAKLTNRVDNEGSIGEQICSPLEAKSLRIGWGHMFFCLPPEPVMVHRVLPVSDKYWLFQELRSYFPHSASSPISML
jgi:hypothetical protein